MFAWLGVALSHLPQLLQNYLWVPNLAIGLGTALVWSIAARGQGFKPRAIFTVIGLGGWFLAQFMFGTAYWNILAKWGVPIGPGWRTVWYGVLIAAWGAVVVLLTPRIRAMMRSEGIFARVRNLEYTKYTLFLLFFWLVWVDFTFVLVEGQNSFMSILKFRMVNELHTDLRLFELFTGTIPAFMNFFMNPIISIKSDRHRGPRGRRIPFLIYSSPFVAVFVALMGFGNEIGHYLYAHLLGGLSPTTVLIWTFGLLFMIFYVFNLFVSVVFYYLFNDVVPQEHFVKFMGYMRVVGLVTQMLYQNFIYGYSNQRGPLNIDVGFIHYHNPQFWYPKLILVGMGLFFLMAFTIACVKVKEPIYPPPQPIPKGQGPVDRLVSMLRLLATECFAHPFYRIVFITLTVEFMFSAAAKYQEPMLLSVGVTPAMMGPINYILAPVTILLTVITATWGDRWHPVPLMVLGTLGLVLTAPVGLLFLIPASFFTNHFHTHFQFLRDPPHAYLLIRVAYTLTHIPVGLITGLAAGPFLMRLYPRERYGQFCAAGNLVRIVVANILGGQLAVWFMSLMQKLPTGWDYGLRYCFVWQMFFQVICLGCYIMLYREWKRLGGKQGYTPPIVEPKPRPEVPGYALLGSVCAAFFCAAGLLFLFLPAHGRFLFVGSGNKISVMQLIFGVQGLVALGAVVLFATLGALNLHYSATVYRELRASNRPAAVAASTRARRANTFALAAGLPWLLFVLGWVVWFTNFKK